LLDEFNLFVDVMASLVTWVKTRHLLMKSDQVWGSLHLSCFVAFKR